MSSTMTKMMKMNLMRVTKISSWIKANKTLLKSVQKVEIKQNQDLASRLTYKVLTALEISSSIPHRLMMKKNSS
jgi:hypothetical protein